MEFLVSNYPPLKTGSTLGNSIENKQEKVDFQK